MNKQINFSKASFKDFENVQELNGFERRKQQSGLVKWVLNRKQTGNTALIMYDGKLPSIVSHVARAIFITYPEIQFIAAKCQKIDYWLDIS